MNTLFQQNLVFTTHGKKIQNSYKNEKLKTSTPTWNEEFELPDGLYSVQDYFVYIIKKT